MEIMKNDFSEPVLNLMDTSDELFEFLLKMPLREFEYRLGTRHAMTKDLQDLYLKAAKARGLVSNQYELEKNYSVGECQVDVEQYEKKRIKTRFESKTQLYIISGLVAMIFSLLTWPFLIIIPIIYLISLAIVHSEFNYNVADFYSFLNSLMYIFSVVLFGIIIFNALNGDCENLQIFLFFED